MALHLSSLYHQSWSATTPINSSDYTRSSIMGKLPTRRLELGWINNQKTHNNKLMNVRLKCGVKASLEITTEAEVNALVGKVTEVTKDSFWPIVNAAQDKTVVVDMYTQWCGPCKVMAPKFELLAKDMLDVIFLKLDCNQENKPLATELGIRVVPTFKILKDKKIVKEVTGAKLDDLVAAIKIVQSSSN